MSSQERFAIWLDPSLQLFVQDEEESPKMQEGRIAESLCVGTGPTEVAARLDALSALLGVCEALSIDAVDGYANEKDEKEGT